MNIKDRPTGALYRRALTARALRGNSQTGKRENSPASQGHSVGGRRNFVGPYRQPGWKGLRKGAFLRNEARQKSKLSNLYSI